MLNLKSNERSNVWLLTRSPPCEWSTTPRLWEHWGPGHRPAAITSALSNLQKHIKYTFTVLSQIVTGSDKGRSAPTRCRVLLQQMRKEKQGSNRQWRQQAPCVLDSFLLQRCLLWCYQSCIDQIWLFLNEHMFLFYREEASKVDDDKNLCFLLCFKALTDIINWNWRQN